MPIIFVHEILSKLQQSLCGFVALKHRCSETKKSLERRELSKYIIKKGYGFTGVYGLCWPDGRQKARRTGIGTKI